VRGQCQDNGFGQPDYPAQWSGKKSETQKEVVIGKFTNQSTLKIGHQRNASPDKRPPHEPADHRSLMQVRMNDIRPLFEGGLERQDYEFEIGQHFAFLRSGLGLLIATNGRDSTDIKVRKVPAQRISAENILPAAGLDCLQNAEHPYVAAAVRKERGWRDVKNFQTRVIRLAQLGCSG